MSCSQKITLDTLEAKDVPAKKLLAIIGTQKKDKKFGNSIIKEVTLCQFPPLARQHYHCI
jgi:hypothetical protein